MNTGMRYTFGRLKGPNNPFGGGQTFVWQLDEATGSTAFSNTGEYNGIISPNVQIDQNGKIGRAYKFNGTDANDALGNVICENFSDLEYGDFTCFFWMKKDLDNSFRNTIISNQLSNSSYSLYCIMTKPNFKFNTLYFGGQQTCTINTNTVCDGNWHRIALLHKKNVFQKIFVDGQFQAQNNLPEAEFQSTDVADLTFGSRRPNGGFHYEDYLDQVVMNINNIATDQEILDDWNNGNGRLYI